MIYLQPWLQVFNLCYILTKHNPTTSGVYYLPINYVICPIGVLHNWSKHLGYISCEYQLSCGHVCQTNWVELISLGVLLTSFEPISKLSVNGSSSSSSIFDLGVANSSFSLSGFIVVSLGCVVFGPSLSSSSSSPKMSSSSTLILTMLATTS